MSYVRPIRKEELVKWIYDHGLAEADTETLAEALVAEFDIITEAHTPI